MTLTSRRSVLKGLAAMAVGSSLAQQGLGGKRGKKAAVLDLNVILHGMFLLDFGDDHILMLSPCVPEHLYRAGNWCGTETYALSSADKLSIGQDRDCKNPAKPYILYGPKYTTRRPRLTKDFNVVLSKQDLQGISQFKIHPEKSKFQVVLPFPHEIRPLRCIKACNAFQGADSHLIAATGLSLCQVLIYRNVDSADLELAPTDWEYHLNEPKGTEPPTANLHFWAEPPYRVPPDHGMTASTLLSELDGLDFHVALDDSPQLDCSVDIAGVREYETQGWAEWVSGGEGTRPVNCSTSIFT